MARESPEPANLIRVHRWPGRMDSLNIRLHAANLLAASPLRAWERQLAVSLLAELALWDPEVCEAGACRSLRELIEPDAWLAELARERGWSPSYDAKSVSAEWQGLSQTFEGQRRVHSAWLALADRQDALAQRVWNGQLAVLFPLLERHRRALLKTCAGLLRVPWQTQFGRIERLEDLELNHMADRLQRQNGRALRDTCDFVCWLRDLRNDLAHLRPISADRLLLPRFADRLARRVVLEDD